MIHTRESIYLTLSKYLKQTCKYGKNNNKEFKKILIAVILNDLKEWSEYKADNKSSEFNQILSDYLLAHSEFKISRFTEASSSYKNVNTPQDNTTWVRILDNTNSKLLTERDVSEVVEEDGVVQLQDCTEILDGNILTTDKCRNLSIIVI